MPLSPNPSTLLKVYDELVSDVPEKRVDTVRALGRCTTESAVAISVSLVVEVGHGASWEKGALARSAGRSGSAQFRHRSRNEVTGNPNSRWARPAYALNGLAAPLATKAILNTPSIPGRD